MTSRVSAWGALVAALAISTPVLATPYTLELTGVGDGASDDGVYLSPYVGTIRNSSGQLIYSGYLICDDFYTHSEVGSPWGATETNAGNLNGTEKFVGESYGFDGTTYDTVQMYNAAAYLANELLQPGNVTNPSSQDALSFAIWDIMDGTTPALDSSTWTDIDGAFTAVGDGYVGSNVEVYTPRPLWSSQEFLVVNGPDLPEPSALTLAFAGLLGSGFVLSRRRRARV